MVQHRLPFEQLPISDTKCLTLNMMVPISQERTKIPVLAYIHGGGYVTGSSSFPQNDLARITDMSTGLGQPMIAIGIK